MVGRLLHLYIRSGHGAEIMRLGSGRSMTRRPFVSRLKRGPPGSLSHSHSALLACALWPPVDSPARRFGMAIKPVMDPFNRTRTGFRTAVPAPWFSPKEPLNRSPERLRPAWCLPTLESACGSAPPDAEGGGSAEPVQRIPKHLSLCRLSSHAHRSRSAAQSRSARSRPQRWRACRRPRRRVGLW